MNVVELFGLGNSYAQQGKGNMAVETWQECIRLDPNFGPAYINLANSFKAMGNLQGSKDALERFMNCPVTGNTIDIVPKIKQEIAELGAKLNPPPAPVK